MENNSIILNCKIITRTSKNEIIGLNENSLKIRIQTPPVDGKANKAIIKLLAKQFKIHHRNISIISGANSRNKRILINNISKDEKRIISTYSNQH